MSVLLLAHCWLYRRWCLLLSRAHCHTARADWLPNALNGCVWQCYRLDRSELMDAMKCSGTLSGCEELLLEGLGYRADWVAGQLSCQPALQVGRNYLWLTIDFTIDLLLVYY